MNRRERDRYDRGDYGSSGYSRDAGYSRDDEHYHSAQNLTNDFEQRYREHRGGWTDENGRDQYRPNPSFYESNRGDAQERHNRGERDYSGDSDYQQRDWDGNRNRNQDYSSHYGSSSDRYNRYQDDFRREQDRYGSDRNRSQQRRDGMNEGSMRQGYGISDYDDMHRSSVPSNRGIPNPGISSSFEDDFGTDLGRSFGDRSYGLSSGSYGGYSSRSRRDD